MNKFKNYRTASILIGFVVVTIALLFVLPATQPAQCADDDPQCSVLKQRITKPRNNREKNNRNYYCEQMKNRNCSYYKSLCEDGDDTGESQSNNEINLSGNWTAHWGNGSEIGGAAIEQQNETLTFYDLCCGMTTRSKPHNISRGHFEGSDTVIASDWGDAGTGKVKNNGRRIEWSNGTYWTR